MGTPRVGICVEGVFNFKEFAAERGGHGSCEEVRLLMFFFGFVSLWVIDIRSTENAAILGRAVVYCPQAEVLWPMGTSVKWLAGDSPNHEVLECTLVANPENEKIWSAAIKMGAENGKLRVARELLIHARIVADTEKVH